MVKEVFHVKVRFFLMTLFFLLLLLASTIGYNYIQKIPNPAKQEFIYSQENKIILFNHPEKRSIILRMDDPGTMAYNELTMRLVNDIFVQNKTITLGVIPERTLNNPEFLQYLQDNVNNPELEIAMHGYNHDENEFSNSNASKVAEKIENGRHIFTTFVGVNPITFIPPYSSFSDNDIAILYRNGFRVFSSSNSRYKIIDDVLVVDYTIEMYDYEKNISHTNQEIVDSCDDSLYKANLCVVAFHPQDFLINGTVIDETKYQGFLKLLQGLDKLNAEYITFKDLLASENTNAQEA